MNSHAVRCSRSPRSARIRRSAAGALVLALIVGHNAFAQAPVTTRSAAASALPPNAPSARPATALPLSAANALPPAAATALPLSAANATPPAAARALAPAAASALPSTSAQDIHDIRGPKPIKSPWLIPLIVITALLSSASVYATWSWWYRRRQRSFLRTPFEIAFARLELARSLLLPELCREFSIEVSNIVREFIESRFQVKAAHLTTHEFLHDSLGSHDPVLAANRALLADFLVSCDLAKFGGWNLSMPTMEAMLQSARRFVVESDVEPEPADPARVAAPTRARTAPTRAAETPSAAPRETYDSVPST